MSEDRPEYHRGDEQKLKAFVRACLERVDVEPAYAAQVADVLVEADARGIESHGIARLGSFYVSRIQAGIMNPRPSYRRVRETPTTVLIDADNGLGHPAAILAMRAIIEKARLVGVAFGNVRNSNHYGIAAYYAMMALEHDMIGFSSTNSVRYAVPTFGRDLMLGTNPFAYAVPAGREPPFVLDFATTTVPLGRLEIYKRRGLPLLEGWAVDAEGEPTRDPDAALAGALLPLGGFGTEQGGHKGYGLGLLSDILCGVLSGVHSGRSWGCRAPTTSTARFRIVSARFGSTHCATSRSSSTIWIASCALSSRARRRRATSASTLRVRSSTSARSITAGRVSRCTLPCLPT
jgi:L-2-hydroxycarboxylate dehydrogenase (NAD+)